MKQIIGLMVATVLTVAPALANGIDDLKSALSKMDATLPAVLEATDKLTDTEIDVLSHQGFDIDKETVTMDQVLGTIAGYQDLFHSNMEQILSVLEKAACKVK